MSPPVTATVPDIPPSSTVPPGLGRLLAEDLGAVMARDPAARNRLEVLLTYPGVHAILLHRVAHLLWRKRLRLAARWLSFMARMMTNIDIHPGATIGRRLFIDHGAGVVIGETAEIGDDVTLYHGVTLGGTSAHKGKRHPTLGDKVLVGAGAKVLGPVTLGAHASVGANSVVISDVPPGMTVVGIPGRVVLPPDRRRTALDEIDLDHHLMPDPVGRALRCLVSRIDELERELARVRAGQEPCDPNEAVTCTACNPICHDVASGGSA